MSDMKITVTGQNYTEIYKQIEPYLKFENDVINGADMLPEPKKSQISTTKRRPIEFQHYSK